MTPRLRHPLPLAWAVLAVCLLVGCGGGGGAVDPGPVARLEGTWMGTAWYAAQLEVTIDGGGKIVRYLDNGVETGIGGAFSHVGGPVFAVDLRHPGGEAVAWRLLLSEGDTHAAFVQFDGLDFAALERGATAVVPHQLEDFAPRAFTGPAVAFDAPGGIAEIADSKVELDSSGLYKGHFGEVAFYTGDGRSIGLREPLGSNVAEGRYDDDDPLRDGNKLVFVMSPDGMFVTGIALEFMADPAPYEIVRFLAAWRVEP